MRISDWSSDVCSSDLLDDLVRPDPRLIENSREAGEHRFCRVSRCGGDLAHQQGLVGAAKNDVREGAADIDANSYAGRCCGHRRPLMSAPIPRRPMAATTRSKACVIMPSPQLGRASGRERVVQYVTTQVV